MSNLPENLQNHDDHWLLIKYLYPFYLHHNTCCIIYKQKFRQDNVMLHNVCKLSFLRHTDLFCTFWPLKRLVILWMGFYWRAVASIAQGIITVLFRKCCNLLSWDIAFLVKDVLARHSLVWTRNNPNVHISLNVFLIDIQEQILGSRHRIQ